MLDIDEPVTDEMDGSDRCDRILGLDALMLMRIESEAGICTDGLEPFIFLIRELPITCLLARPENTCLCTVNLSLWEPCFVSCIYFPLFLRIYMTGHP